MNPETKRVLDILLEGNQQFAGSLFVHPHIDSTRRKECLKGQRPIAAVIGCSDSRVPPEIIFDCGIGDLFIIRMAGCFIDSSAIASVEYAVEHLNVPLVLVLGHSSCGALTAAVTHKKEEGYLGTLLDSIREICMEKLFLL